MVNKMVKIRIGGVLYNVIEDNNLLVDDVRDMVLKAVHFLNLIDDDLLPNEKDDALFSILEDLYQFRLEEYEPNPDIIEF